MARESHGRVVFVAGALPGELVRARVTEVHRDFARARLEAVVKPSPQRIEPSCPEVERGCGGCDLAHLSSPAQPHAKVGMVVDALRRLGRIEDPVVTPGDVLTNRGFRTTVRAAVETGRAGLRRARSHEVVHVEHCLVAHPALDELLTEGRFGDAREVTLRVGTGTRERLAVVAPRATGVSLPPDVLVVGENELRRGRRAWFHEVVGDRRFRISARSFFQSRSDGASGLVEAVRVTAGEVLTGPGLAVDAYCGVGLFASCLASGLDVPDDEARRFLAVERSSSSASDARHNLADRRAKILNAPVERLGNTAADLVIADPSRAGLGRPGVKALAGTGADRLVLVSCDPAALGRDAGLLREAGYRFVSARLVDLFPDTHHVEVVSRFDR